MGLDSNVVTLSGRLTRDADFKVLQLPDGQKKVVNFTLANSFRRKENETNFFDIEFWTKSDFYDSKLTKGTFIVIEGYLKQQRWLNKMDNTNRSKIVVVANKIISIEPKMNNYQSNNNAQQNSNYNSNSMENNNFEIQSQDSFASNNFYNQDISDAPLEDDENNIY